MAGADVVGANANSVEKLEDVIARSAELASRSSTIRAICSPTRTIRPYPCGLSTIAVMTVAAAPAV